MPLNDRAKNIALDALDESVAGSVTHIGIHNVSDPGTGLTANAGEASGGSPAYARKAVTWDASSAGQKSNSAALTFDVPTGDYAFFTLWNAATLNNGTQYLGHVPFGGASALKGWFSINPTLSADEFRSVAHGLSNGNRVQLFGTFAETLPTGVSEGTIYFVVGAATDTFQLSTTSGGSAIDVTATGGGEGYWQRLVPETFGAQGQITAAIGAVILDATAM